MGRWQKYVCPYCGRVLAVGEIYGTIVCKRCKQLVELQPNKQGLAHQVPSESRRG